MNEEKKKMPRRGVKEKVEQFFNQAHRSFSFFVFFFVFLTVTLYPLSASRIAVAAPMPAPPPVTRALRMIAERGFENCDGESHFFSLELVFESFF